MIVKPPLPIVQQRDEMSTFLDRPCAVFLSANGVALPDPLGRTPELMIQYSGSLYDPELQTFTRVFIQKKVFSSLRRICGRQTDSLRRSDPEQPTPI